MRTVQLALDGLSGEHLTPPVVATCVGGARRISTHVQGALMLERHRWLWRARKPKSPPQPLSHLSVQPPISLAVATPGGSSAATSSSMAHPALTQEAKLSFERPKEQGGQSRGRPQSLFTASPHVLVGGALGALLRLPCDLSKQARRRRRPRLPLHSSSNATCDCTRQGIEALAPGGLETVSLRPFASALGSIQLGGFERPLFDYTHLSARLDLGLTAPDATEARQLIVSIAAARTRPLLLAEPRPGFPSVTQASSSSSSPGGSRLFALEGKGLAHALSVSAAQQVYGPLRAKVDLRFGLDSAGGSGSASHSAGKAGLPRAVGAVVDHVSSIQPVLLDCVYGVDMAIPQAGGLARVVGWYSPIRREAMAELRLF